MGYCMKSASATMSAMIWLVLLCGPLGVLSSSEEQTFTLVAGVNISEAREFIPVSGYVHHMETDLADPQTIIVAIDNALHTTDGVTTALYAGSDTESYAEGSFTDALFTSIRGFAQINTTTIIVADRDNHCFRLLDRGNLQTSEFLGECGTLGSRIEPTPLFNRPWSIVRVPTSETKIIFSCFNNHAVFEADILTKVVTVIISTGLTSPTGVVFDYTGENILVSDAQGVKKYNLGTDELTTVAGGPQSGFVDGALEDAQFKYVLEILPLSAEIMVVNDQSADQVRIINTALNEVSSVGVSRSNSLLLFQDRMLVGSVDSIQQIDFEVYNPWSQCHLLEGSCIQTRAPAVSSQSVVQNCPVTCRTAEFEVSARYCPTNVLKTRQDMKTERLCPSICTKMELCTGFVYNSVKQVCYFIDNYKAINDCQPLGEKSWIRQV